MMMELVTADGLSGLLQSKPISRHTQNEIATKLWAFHSQNCQAYGDDISLELYFNYYAVQSDLALHDGGRHALTRSHRDIIEITNLLRQGLTRNEVKLELTSQSRYSNVENDLLEASIDLAARLLLMVEIGHIRNGYTTNKQLLWEDQSLQRHLESHFEPPEASTNQHIKLEKLFIAKNLHRIARIKIIWTDNLADHLRMFEYDAKVAIFHHASFLKVARNRQESNSMLHLETNFDSGMFPEGLVEETLRTLALLFPQLDPGTRKWLKKLAPRKGIDLESLNCGRLNTEERQISRFTFWRDRLAILKEAFDEAEPNTLGQWWYDRRRGLQRYPLLLAAIALAITVFLGLVQCIEGALQVYRAYYPPLDR